MDKQDHKEWIQIVGGVLVLSLFQFSLAAFELGSKAHVSALSCPLDDCMRSYLTVAFLWTLGVTLLIYGTYHLAGAITAVVINLLFIGWIYYSYKGSHKAAQRYMKLKNHV